MNTNKSKGFSSIIKSFFNNLDKKQQTSSCFPSNSSPFSTISKIMLIKKKEEQLRHRNIQAYNKYLAQVENFYNHELTIADGRLNDYKLCLLDSYLKEQ